MLKTLSEKLVLDTIQIIDDTAIVKSHTMVDNSKKRHSSQVRIVKDIPYNGLKIVHHITVNRYFVEHSKKTIMEKLDFVSSTRRRTKRLDQLLENMQKETSFIALERIANKDLVSISDSTLLRMIKKKHSI